jgi:hypothetical protein
VQKRAVKEQHEHPEAYQPDQHREEHPVHQREVDFGLRREGRSIRSDVGVELKGVSWS